MAYAAAITDPPLPEDPIMCRLRLAVAIAVAAVQPALSATLVHDSVGEFTSIVSRQAPGVAAARSIIAEMFDNSYTISPVSFYTLGLSPTASTISGLTLPAGSTPTASIDFFIDPTRRILGGAFSEATGTTSGHAEQADIYLIRQGDAAWHRIGTVHNGHALSPAAPNGRVLNADPIVTWTIHTIASVGGGYAYNYSFTINDGIWNGLRMVDGRASTGSGRDGFDVLEFELTSAALPEPGGMLAFGAGLLGLAGFGRRKGARPG